MRIKGSIIWVSTVLLLAGCSSSQFGWKEAPGTSESKTKMDESFDPLSLNDDDLKIEKKISGSEQDSLKSNVSNLIQSGIQPVKEDRNNEDFSKGFRVQLLATADEEMARKEKKKAVFKFDDNVYLIFEAPMYKIRVGDCITRKQAEILKKRAVRNGFTDAWVVPSPVIKH
ncbi:SPOR domain-containing protein [bacterium]|nr:SPOR domain-containing protein [bacterium]